MRIAIEAFSLSSEQLTGVGNVTLNYLRELKKIDRDNRYYIYTIDELRHVSLSKGRWVHVRYDPWIKRKKYAVAASWERFKEAREKKAVAILAMISLRLLKMAFEIADTIYLHAWMAASLRKNKIDAYLGIFADFFPFIFFPRLRKIWLVHDIVWKLYPKTTKKKSLLGGLLIVRNMKKADLLISVSESTKKGIREFLGIATDIVTLHNAADRSLFFPADSASVSRVKRKFGIKQKYLLSVCTLEPRKNLGALLRAYEEMTGRERYQLVLTGMSGWKNTGLFDRLERHPGRENIIITGYIPDKDLAPLYTGAELFVYPALYEGFGLPVLEAMQCGCPVVSSNTSSIPEVAGDAAVLVDPSDIGALAQAMETVLSDRRLRRAMVKKGLARAELFSWERSARRLLALFEPAGNNQASVSRTPGDSGPAHCSEIVLR